MSDDDVAAEAERTAKQREALLDAAHLAAAAHLADCVAEFFNRLLEKGIERSEAMTLALQYMDQETPEEEA